MEARYVTPEVTAQSRQHHRISPLALSHSAPLPGPPHLPAPPPPASSPLVPPNAASPSASNPLTTTTTGAPTAAAPSTPPSHQLSLPPPPFNTTNTSAAAAAATSNPTLHNPISPLSSARQHPLHHHHQPPQPQTQPPHHQGAQHQGLHQAQQTHPHHDTMPVAIYDISKLHQAQCRVICGKVYNGKGHTICGVLNQHDRPCHRIGRCPFHYYSSPVSAENVCNGVVDANGTAFPEHGRVYGPDGTLIPSPLPGEAGSSGGGAANAALSITPPKKVQYKHGWTKEEHYLFLHGLRIHGRGAWKQIAHDVKTRTPTQVQSHAQKFYLRQKQTNKNKRSIHDLTLDSPEMAEIEKQMSVQGAPHPDLAAPRRPAPSGLLAGAGSDDFGSMFGNALAAPAQHDLRHHTSLAAIGGAYPSAAPKDDARTAPPPHYSLGFRHGMPPARMPGPPWYDAKQPYGAPATARSPLPAAVGWPGAPKASHAFPAASHAFPAASHAFQNPVGSHALDAGAMHGGRPERFDDGRAQHFPRASAQVHGMLAGPGDLHAPSGARDAALYGGQSAYPAQGNTVPGMHGGSHFTSLHAETPNTSVYLNGEVALGSSGGDAVANMLSAGKTIVKPQHRGAGRARASWSAQLRGKAELGASAMGEHPAIGATFESLAQPQAFLADITDTQPMDMPAPGSTAPGAQAPGSTQNAMQGGRAGSMYHPAGDLRWKRAER